VTHAAKRSGRKAAPRLRLQVADRGRPRTPRAFVSRVVRAVLAFGKRPDFAVSLLLTNDREIAAVHATHLGDATATDVISFDDDGDAAEIVVSVETAHRVARERGHRGRDEVALYIVHGLLHVLGFDDTTPRQRVRMRAAERACMKRLGLVVAAVDA
jgi:probable rRNA maturation factor